MAGIASLFNPITFVLALSPICFVMICFSLLNVNFNTCVQSHAYPDVVADPISDGEKCFLLRVGFSENVYFIYI